MLWGFFSASVVAIGGLMEVFLEGGRDLLGERFARGLVRDDGEDILVMLVEMVVVSEERVISD